MAGRAVTIGLFAALGVPLCAACRSNPPGPDKVEDGALVDRHDPRSAPLAGVREDAPHVVLVIGCTVRRDQVSPYGGPPETTPVLSRLAADGVRLADPIAAAPWTRASSAAILTGQHALALGVVEPTARRSDRVLPPEATTLAESFRTAGYVTVGATANPNLNDVFGFAQGFDRYLQPRGLWRDVHGKVSAGVLIPEVLQTLDTRPDPERPVFLQVLLIDAHAPFPGDPSELSRVGGRGVPEKVRRYRTGLAAFDRAVGELKTALETRGLTDANTYFVVTSDHGEGLSWPEHHGRSHGRYLYSSAVDAIGIAVGPELRPGHVVGGVASGVDMTPTLMGLAQLPGYTGPGVDLSPALRGQRAGTGRAFTIADTWFMTANRAAIFTSELVCMRSFSEDGPSAPTGQFNPGCYDRVRDPNQLSPLEVEHDVLVEKLLAWRLSAAPLGRAAVLDAELADQLRLLGYTDE